MNTFADAPEKAELGDVAGDADVEQPVVELRVRRDVHAAAVGLAVADRDGVAADLARARRRASSVNVAGFQAIRARSAA